MNHVRIMTGVGAALMAWQTLATPVAAEPISFREYQSAKDVSMHELKDDVPFSPLWHAAGTPVLDLDSSKPSHKYLGLGVSFAEASCKILMELSSAEREKVMRMVRRGQSRSHRLADQMGRRAWHFELLRGLVLEQGLSAA